MPRLSFLVLIFVLLAGEAESETFPGDIAAIKTLIEAIEATSIPAGSCLASWDFSLDPCSSAYGPRFTCGLRCDAVSGRANLSRVTDLTLDSAGYSGVLPTSIWSLPFLESLELSSNRFHGSIPFPRRLPPALRRISLSRNSLSGVIPAFPSSPSLQELYLDGNRLSGPFLPLPFPSLCRLDLRSNNLSGQIPDLRHLPSLSFFDASSNSFSGPFPSLPPSLIHLSLRSNLLSGGLSGASLASLPSLQVLDLSFNALSGAAPAAAFHHPALQQLSLSGNSLDRVENPAGSVAGSRVVALDLARNRLSGLLPQFLGSMRQLAAVNLEDNRFTGLIPAQYAARALGLDLAAVPFSRLLLGGNYLYGPVPAPMQGMKEGDALVDLARNCLFYCPDELFFCAGGGQKPPDVCRDFNPTIP